MRVHFTPVTVFFWLLLLAVTIVHVFFYQRFGQDHKLEIFGIEIGIVLAIFGLMGTESLQWWCHRLFGVRFGDFRNYIRASVFGVGGAGKSSLINSAFMNLITKLLKNVKSPHLKLRLCSILGQLVRHSTVIGNEVAESGLA